MAESGKPTDTSQPSMTIPAPLVWGISEGANVDILVKTGELRTISRDDVLPLAQQEKIFRENKGLPVYVVSGRDRANKTAPPVVLMRTDKDKPYLLITEEFARWREEDAREYSTFADHALPVKPLEEVFSTIRSATKLDESVKQTERMFNAGMHALEEKQSIRNVKHVVTAKPIEEWSDQLLALTIESTSGNNYVVMSPKLVEMALASKQEMKQVLFVIAHEDSHISNGHNKPITIADYHNLMGSSVNGASEVITRMRSRELLADLEGASHTKGMGDYKAAEAFILRYTDEQIKGYLDHSTIPREVRDQIPPVVLRTLASYMEAKDDPRHYALELRVAALEQAAKEMLVSTRESTTEKEARIQKELIARYRSGNFPQSPEFSHHLTPKQEENLVEAINASGGQPELVQQLSAIGIPPLHRLTSAANDVHSISKPAVTPTAPAVSSDQPTPPIKKGIQH